MIEIVLGNIGSGKTACAVRELVQNKDGRVTYSNILTKKVKNNIVLKPNMITKVNVDEKGKETLALNVEFWQQTVKKHKRQGINVIIDEAHIVVNSRRSMSKQNIIFTEFLALLRRVIGGSVGYGKLTLITQLPRRLDSIARDMATLVKFHVCHYIVECSKCGACYSENNEEPEKITHCPHCKNYKLKTHSHIIERFHFKNIEEYEKFELFGQKTYHRHYFIGDISDYFSNYDTLQWDNLLSVL